MFDADMIVVDKNKVVTLLEHALPSTVGVVHELLTMPIECAEDIRILQHTVGVLQMRFEIEQVYNHLYVEHKKYCYE